MWAIALLQKPYYSTQQPRAFEVHLSTSQLMVPCCCAPVLHIQRLLWGIYHSTLQRRTTRSTSLTCKRQPVSFWSTRCSTLKCTGCCILDVMRIWLCSCCICGDVAVACYMQMPSNQNSKTGQKVPVGDTQYQCQCRVHVQKAKLDNLAVIVKQM